MGTEIRKIKQKKTRKTNQNSNQRYKEKIKPIVKLNYNIETPYYDQGRLLTQQEIIDYLNKLYTTYYRNLKNFIDSKEHYSNIFNKTVTELISEGFTDSIYTEFIDKFHKKYQILEKKSKKVRKMDAFSIHSREIEQIAIKYPPYAELPEYNPNSHENREKYILHNLKLALDMAIKYNRKTNNPLLDLLQEGYVGLIEAYDKYKTNKGTKFSTYARSWIMAKIVIYLDNKSRTVKVPKSMLEQIKKENDQYPANNTKSFSEFETEEEGNGSGFRIMDMIAIEDVNIADKAEEKEVFNIVFKEMLKCVSNKERSFIKEYYQIDLLKNHGTPKLNKQRLAKKYDIEDISNNIEIELGKMKDEIISKLEIKFGEDKDYINYIIDKML